MAFLQLRRARLVVLFFKDVKKSSKLDELKRNSSMKAEYFLAVLTKFFVLICLQMFALLKKSK